ncbi:hypothetical protein [Sphingomonas xinjiangensis]|uniref:Uncharacterized protein n=1 Tax=Sphingomonas xinjiangensis TaxID=643568 RepID=A0A840YR47_9SPHN|nr:hypothetical protein [Sphingomonas xinjiangensis]MBB5711213.1 hypothetical protein [Sphingomonas xinjiangensis]
MTIQPPPSRYKVVERGRRLEVIDTRTGERATSHHAPPPLSGGESLFPSMRRLRPSPPAAGTAGLDADTFVTKSFYDARAPRTIRINDVTRRRLDGVRFGGAIIIALLVAFAFLFWPLALGVFGFLLSDKVRTRLHAASTRFVDTLDQAR